MSTSHFMMELKAVSSMPAASMPTMDGVNSTSGHLKRSDPMVITCTQTTQPQAPRTRLAHASFNCPRPLHPPLLLNSIIGQSYPFPREWSSPPHSFVHSMVR